MKNHNTVKRFYNEYANKLVVRNQLAHLFREKQWTHARTHLDRLQHEVEKGQPLQRARGQRIESIQVQHLQEARILFNELYQRTDIKLRVENPRMQIYSNDLKLLERLSTKLGNCIELWSPSADVPLIPVNTIILERPMPYEYRVTLASWVTDEFASWIDNNLDKIKIGKRCLTSIQNRHYTQGLYFYVRNERFLQLLNLVMGNCVQRIDKVIYKQNLDK